MCEDAPQRLLRDSFDFECIQFLLDIWAPLESNRMQHREGMEVTIHHTSSLYWIFPSTEYIYNIPWLTIRYIHILLEILIQFWFEVFHLRIEAQADW